jgi:hypothetical protein
MKKVWTILLAIFDVIEKFIGISGLVYKGTTVNDDTVSRSITVTICFESISTLDTAIADFIMKYLKSIETSVEAAIDGNNIVITIQY